MVRGNPTRPHLRTRPERPQHPHSLHSLHRRSRLGSIGIRDRFRRADPSPAQPGEVLTERGRERRGLRRSAGVVRRYTNGHATPWRWRGDGGRPRRRRRRRRRGQRREVRIVGLLRNSSGECGGRPGWWLWLRRTRE